MGAASAVALGFAGTFVSEPWAAALGAAGFDAGLAADLAAVAFGAALVAGFTAAGLAVAAFDAAGLVALGAAALGVVAFTAGVLTVEAALVGAVAAFGVAALAVGFGFAATFGATVLDFAAGLGLEAAEADFGAADFDSDGALAMDYPDPYVDAVYMSPALLSIRYNNGV